MGATTTITATGADSYSWNTGATTDSIVVTPSASQSFAVTGTASNGCANSITIPITVNTLPGISISASSPVICAGGTTLLAANGGNSYVWNTSSTNSSVSVSPVSNTTYSVTGTDNNGCAGTASVTIIVNPLPSVNFNLVQNSICVSDGVQNLTASPSGGIFSGTGVSGTSFDPALSGNGTFGIDYLYTDANGCSANATDTISVNTCTAIAESMNWQENKISPNPGNGHFTFVAAEEGENLLEIFDVAGKLVFALKTSNRTEQINIEDLSDGIYYLRVNRNNKNATQRIVIAK